jgi:hypothetical protein
MPADANSKAESSHDAKRLIVAVLPIVYLLIIGSWSMKTHRYLIPIVPFLAGGAIYFISNIPGFIGAHEKTAKALVMAIFAAAMIQPFIGGVSASIVSKDTRELARQWIEGNIPQNTMIAKEMMTPVLRNKAKVEILRNEIGILEEKGRRRGADLLSAVKTYRVVEIPLYVIEPEYSIPYYDIRLYCGVDCMVTSSYVKNRYMAQPDNYPVQIAFYDDLVRYWKQVAVFRPSGVVGGPEVAIFQKKFYTDKRIDKELEALTEDWFRKSKLNPQRLHLFVKPLADGAIEKGNYALGEILLKGGDLGDPEVCYTLAALLILNRKYEEMLIYIDFLCLNFKLKKSMREGLSDREWGGLSVDSARMMSRQIFGLLMRAHADTTLHEDTRDRVDAYIEDLAFKP